MDAKLNIKRLKLITSASVSTAINSTPTYAAVASVLPLPQNIIFTENSIMLACQIKVDRFEEVQKTGLGNEAIDIENEGNTVLQNTYNREESIDKKETNYNILATDNNEYHESRSK